MGSNNKIASASDGYEGLVSIGIPTYNRRDALERSVRSALAQDYANIEVVVADDASTDGSWEMLTAMAEEDRRLRAVRHRTNLGHAANFAYVFEAARGAWFMWLSDDDWIDHNYVSTCLAGLDENPSASLVCGTVAYEETDRVMLERPASIDSGTAALRVLDYFAHVNSNGPLFGLTRRSTLQTLPEAFEETIGGDWFLVGQLAAIGCVVTAPGTTLHRSPSGISSDPAAFAAGEFGLTGREAHHHHVRVAGDAFGRIRSGEGAFRLVGPGPTRLFVASLAGLAILGRFVALPSLIAAARAAGGGRLLDRLKGLIQSRRAASR